MGTVPARAKFAAPPSSKDRTHWGSVLIIDDEGSTLEAVAQMLLPYCRVATGSNGADAFRLAESCAPDAILLDLELPDLRGIEVCKALRAREGTADVPIVIFTQHGDQLHQEEAFDAGATDFIVKPLDAAVIRTRVRNLIQSRKRLLHTLQLSDARWRFALEGSEFGMWDWNLETGQMLSSPALCKIVGLPMTDHVLTPEDWLDWTHPSDRPRVETHLQALQEGHTSGQDLEYRIRTLDGGQTWIRERARVVQRTSGVPVRIMALVADTTAQRTSERRIIKLSRQDPVTELPNRKACIELLSEELLRVRSGGAPGCLIRIDMSGLARANHALGRSAGDELLLQASNRLQAFFPRPQAVCQFGGKEFALIFRSEQVELEEREQPLRLGAELRRTMSAPFTVRGQRVTCECHLGATLLSPAEADAEEHLRRAELALVEARRHKQGIRLFEDEMLHRVAERARLLADLEQAVFTEQIQLAYQPIVTTGGKVIGVEALARWHHPKLGMVRPDHFIPLAEESGLIIPLGARLRKLACAQLSRWSKDERTRGLTISVNVSPEEFMTSGFVRDVSLLVRNGSFDPSRLQLELTESLLLSDFEDIALSMRQLQDLGVGFALDDFGTGYSSLSYLKKLPFKRLKVDRSFVRDILTSPTDLALSRTIVAMGHNLGLEIVAEGVEDESQAQLLSEMGCTMFQGYLYGRPSNIKDVEALVPKNALGEESETVPRSRPSNSQPPSARGDELDFSASILIVDDDRMTLELMRHVLSEYRNVRMTTDPHLGKKMAMNEPPELLILDRAMEGLEGIQLWEELRRTPALADVPVIFVTAFKDPEVEVRAFSAGASDFVTKPISAARLRVAVRNQLRRKRLTDTLKHQASIDPVTGIANRRSFSRAFSREMDRARQTNSSLSLLILDVDHFKSINDALGHLAGDACLTSLGKLLKLEVNIPTDLSARYGGDEFAILMPLTNEEDAEERAQRLVRAVRSANIGASLGLTAPVTVSVGWATFDPQVNLEPEFDLIELADQALLRAKESGRDRACGPHDVRLLSLEASNQ